MKPFLKWVGGKSQIMDRVLPLFPRDIHHYYEPFVGGGSVLLGVMDLVRRGDIRVTGRVRVSDVNAGLIGVYKNVQQETEGVIREVERLVGEFRGCRDGEVNREADCLEEALSSPESYYYWIRRRYNAMTMEEKCEIEGSALFIFLNKTCFRGLYREGPRGFNVPYGNYKKPAVIDPEHLRAVAVLIQDVEFRVGCFREVLEEVGEGDFVYFDPPYAGEEGSFVGYQAGGFRLEDHEALFKKCQEMAEKGIGFVLSNADVGMVQEWFGSGLFKMEKIICRRAINSKRPESVAGEVLVSLK